MKKALLLCAAALFSLVASAGDGLVAVGANVILLPSSRWDGDIEWKAWTWVYNTQTPYGDWNTDNPNYNLVLGDYDTRDDLEGVGPAPDANGVQWYELGFDMSPKDEDLNYYVWDEDGYEVPIVWEEHTAPFSSDDTYNGRPSYQWTTNSIIADIYVRRTFTTDQLLAGPVYLACGHDDAPCEYYINGVLVFRRTGYEGEREETDNDGNIHIVYDNGWNNDEYILLTDEQKALINLNGEENVVAFHVHQNWGGALADCGLYTKLEGGLDMGYTTPWEGKVLFNNYGGWGGHIIDNIYGDENLAHPWSALYEAQEGDEYTFLLEGSSPEDSLWREQLHFKTPIKIDPDYEYYFKVWLGADKPLTQVIVKLTDNDDDDIELGYEEVTIEAPEEGEEYEGTLVEIPFDGLEADNFKIAFDFGGGQDSTTVTIKDISLVKTSSNLDEDDEELWVGTHYFNFFDMHKTVIKYMVWDVDNEGKDYQREARDEEEMEWADEVITFEQVNAPEVTGRTETKAWTLPDFDDSMWDDMMMPVGSEDQRGAVPELQSIWPGGNNTNFWIRRNFELDKINDRLSYDLNVCHDDAYETYVNGVLLQKYSGWTNGKSPVQVHIPAKYLNVGKNVIATYIQQNWGGKFYDCGINVTEINYDECIKLFNDVLAYAETDTLLTNRMHADIDAIIANAQQFYQENKNDPAELRAYARDTLRTKINTIFSYSSAVKLLKDTRDICRRMEDTGYWGTAIDDATAALDTCATAGQLNSYLEALRNARKATAMERRTEKFVGSVPQAMSTEYLGWIDPVDFDGNPIPKYYIYNVGAKLFLGGGEDWGTHLALEYDSNPMMLIQASKEVVDEDGEPTGEEELVEGAYYVETFRPNGAVGSADFMGWNGYIDVGLGSTWEIIPVEGKPNVYNIAQYGTTLGNPSDTTFTFKSYNGTEYGPESKNLLGLRSGDNRYAPSYYVVDTDNHSPELETNQWMFITREELLGFLATASEENPADLSFLITNPGYDQRWSIDEWIFTNGSVFGRGGNHANFVFEAYNAEDFEMTQDLWPDEGEEALPAGTYVLEVQGYYRDGDEGAHVAKYLAHQPVAQRANFFAKIVDGMGEVAWEESMPLMPIHIEADKVPGIGWTNANGLVRVPGTYSGQPMNATDQAGMEYFPCGLYKNRLGFTLTEATDHITIGIIKEYDEDRPHGDWCVMDNWRLRYYGTDVEDPDAIKGIVSDEINNTNKAGKGIFNMLGQRMSKAQKGVNIVNGKKVIKK